MVASNLVGVTSLGNRLKQEHFLKKSHAAINDSAFQQISNQPINFSTVQNNLKS
jgi:hypothetical protein